MRVSLFMPGNSGIFLILEISVDSDSNPQTVFVPFLFLFGLCILMFLSHSNLSDVADLVSLDLDLQFLAFVLHSEVPLDDSLRVCIATYLSELLKLLAGGGLDSRTLGSSIMLLASHTILSLEPDLQESLWKLAIQAGASDLALTGA